MEFDILFIIILLSVIGSIIGNVKNKAQSAKSIAKIREENPDARMLAEERADDMAKRQAARAEQARSRLEQLRQSGVIRGNFAMEASQGSEIRNLREKMREQSSKKPTERDTEPLSDTYMSYEVRSESRETDPYAEGRMRQAAIQEGDHSDPDCDIHDRPRQSSASEARLRGSNPIASRSVLRNAIVMSEILGKPVSKRRAGAAR